MFVHLHFIPEVQAVAAMARLMPAGIGKNTLELIYIELFVDPVDRLDTGYNIAGRSSGDIPGFKIAGKIFTHLDADDPVNSLLSKYCRRKD